MPEEINRIVSDHVSDLLFVPSSTGMNNLVNEGLENAVKTGDLMVDVLFHFKDKLSDKIVSQYNLKKKSTTC